MNRLYFILLLWPLLITFSASASEEDKGSKGEGEEGEEVAILARPIYVPVKPAFVVNYGGPGKLKYFKVGISLRVEDTSAANAVRHHMPLIRDDLVRLFSRQTDADIDTLEGKERLRQTALESIQKTLMDEDGEQGVVNLYFENLVVQK